MGLPMSMKKIFVRFGYKLEDGGGVTFDAKSSDKATPQQVLDDSFRYLAFAARANGMELHAIKQLLEEAYRR